jgi:hypothetical protein
MSEPGRAPEETTAGKAEAVRAWRESRRSRQRTRGLLADVTKQLQQSAALRERNHFTDGVKNMLRGAS